MKATYDTSVLADAITWAARHIPARPVTPVLSGIHLVAGDEDTALSVFDHDISARCTIPAVVAEPGTVLVSGRILAEVVKALPAGKPVDLALSGSELVITCGPAEFSLLTMPVEDYPTLPAVPDTIGTCDAEHLTRAISQVAAAASKDDTLPMLTGIHITATPDTLNLAATDRYRIAATTLPWQPTGDSAEQAVLVPAAPLGSIAKTLNGGPTEIGIADGGMISIANGGRVTTVRLLDPQFIDYAPRLVLDQMTMWAEADKNELVAAVKRVALVAAPSAPIYLAFTADHVQVSAGGDTGRGTDIVASSLDGEAVDIAFGEAYLLDGLAGVPGNRVRIGMTGSARPGLFLDADGESTFRYLLMAVRVS